MDDTVLKGGEMSDGSFNIIEMIWRRKWDNLLILVFIVVSSIVSSVFDNRAAQNAVEDTRKVVREEIAPVVLAVETATDSIQTLEQQYIRDARDAALTAFQNKIFTIEDLQPLTQNGLAVRNGLQIPEIREALAIIDLERVLLFEAYFAGN